MITFLYNVNCGCWICIKMTCYKNIFESDYCVSLIYYNKKKMGVHGEEICSLSCKT